MTEREPMPQVMFDFRQRPELEDAVFVEGLPGVGNIGKMVADYLVKKLDMTKAADIYSQFFPPQVLLDSNGLITQVKNELYFLKREDGRDLLFLVGDYQCLTPEGQYVIVDNLLRLGMDLGVTEVITLGGYGLGYPVEDPKVLGAATNEEMTERPRELGVIFGEGEEPSSGIVGASGLLLGMGKAMGLHGICLMGQTAGFMVDPNSSEEVLKVLMALLGLEFDHDDFKDEFDEAEELLERLKAIGAKPSEGSQNGNDVNYIA